ncbi:hypothetical protein TIFTF001_014945 [Ficus carica]|uniref:Uncharacterized protein n=1 Tax=Ficus carica TaxID=3494 RepID=A0AA87ZXT1_FICCA|nr:hypothetical protein TIFTF001_014945 [Ficus carica]
MVLGLLGFNSLNKVELGATDVCGWALDVGGGYYGLHWHEKCEALKRDANLGELGLCDAASLSGGLILGVVVGSSCAWAHAPFWWCSVYCSFCS